MAEHLSGQTIELYRLRQIDAPERQRTDAHLAVCEDCLKRVLNAEHSVLAFDALAEAFLPSVGEEPFHVSDSELTSHLASSSAKADQIIIESHLAICGPCKGRMRVLSAAHLNRAFDSEDQAPKWRLPWRALGLSVPAQVAAAIAVIGVLFLGILIWQQKSSVSVREESASNGSETTSASPPADPSKEASPQNGGGPNTTHMVLATLRDNNREIQLSQDGELTGLEEFDDSVKRMVKAALAGENLVKPKVLNDVSSPPIKLLGDPSTGTDLELIGPVGRIIAEDRPTFRWRALSGATSYVVSIFDENFNRLARSQVLSKTNWTVTEPLPRGRVYTWEVTATKEGKEITAPVAPAARAEFNILEAEKAGALTKLKQRKPVSRLALGLMYAHLGLVNEAESQFRQLAKENPDSAPARKLLRTVQDWQTR